MPHVRRRSLEPDVPEITVSPESPLTGSARIRSRLVQRHRLGGRTWGGSRAGLGCACIRFSGKARLTALQCCILRAEITPAKRAKSFFDFAVSFEMCAGFGDQSVHRKPI